MDDYKIHQGDAWKLAKILPDQSIQTIITSPPYWGLRDYGETDQFGLEATPEEYIDKLVALMRELRRALRDDGTLWINIGDSYNGSGGAGGDYGVGGLKEGQPKYPGRNVATLKPKDLCGIPWSVALALRADGWYLRSDIIWAKNNPMPESVRDRPTKSHEYIFLLSKSARYYYDIDSIREPLQESSLLRVANGWNTNKLNVSGSLSRGETVDTSMEKMGTRFAPEKGRNRRTVWTVNSSPYRGAHFATFPPALIEPCVLAGCPPGEIVLDPFMGSGTTAVVALALGRQAVGFELNPDYIVLADKRIAASRVVKKVAPPKLESQLDGLPLFTKLLKGERSNAR